MKNKGLIITIISVVIFVICNILFVLKLENINNLIFNTKWYHYNNNTGLYEILYIDNELSYYLPCNDNYTDGYSFCSSFKYSKIKKSFIFDCGKTMKIIDVNNTKLVIETEGKEKVFFQNVKKSKEYEFNIFFNSTKEKFIIKKKQSLDIIEIKKEEILNLLKEKEYSKIIFVGNKCKTIECVLIYELTEKWISFSKNVYYVNSDNLDNKYINELNKLLNISIDYNDIYPTVIVINDNKLIDTYNIKCLGFNCSMYYNK